MAVPVAFFAVFFAYPVAAITGRGLTVDGVWQFGRIGEVLGDPDIRGVLWFTTWQALASTGLTLLIALPAAYVFARLDFPGKQLLRAVVTVPFVLPTVVVGTAFLALLGRGGLLDELWGVRLDTSVWAILLAHVFFNYAVVVRTVGGLWSQLDPRQEEAARVLGAGRFAAWRRVTLPALVPAVAAAALMVFLFTFTSFGVVQILGGPAYSTLEVEIYRQTAQFLDLPTAAVLTLVQFAAVGAILAVHAWTVRRRESALKLVDPSRTARKPRGVGQWALLGGVLATVAALILVPLGVLVERSLDGPDGYGLGYYRALQSAGASGGTFLVPPLEAVWNSLEYALAATAIALVVGGLAAAALTRRAGRLVRGFDALLMLPLGVSAVTVGFGFLITLDEPPLDLRTSWILVPLAQALVGVPFVVRTMLPVLRAVDERLREAAAVLGASPLRVWREVDLPMVRRALLVAAGFAFAVSLGEFGATVFIARPDNPTLPVAVARLLGRAGDLNYGQAMALSTILMVVCAVALLVLERMRPDRSGSGEF
ncbi:iron ABC transporter permease [Streptomyces agglomeratus]|uniref:Iron ABC transporter permease n=1 Tax=Streptomyces agglomeratus TaxID=285458 RepID=A0A1E5PIJ5_9ACTN|nr:iron ABC transporter permease [Streptomyces agglomeratus]OEJ29346.1 iron ABC transporter permease [Streptomyces agglomeratus]OEJ42646.1 iron ABC transporter permease [Streptomyces agglomeratus]OEJ48843.1 iron ABC transporter permease [Streptomyces agglomeratus]OEJ55961.1 iron ABC transporter permease [Streptomyces agglomeratus]OEJ63346.1 iron ABC transporter permease [Streptomyces agglomeratus]